jgi:hypothetical protein
MAARAKPWWDLGSRLLTIGYWGAVALVLLGLLSTRLLPLVDYPQHLALAALLKRIIVGDPAATALFETNLVSYNSAFHVVVALLHLALPIEIAGSIVIGGGVVLAAIAVLRLLDATDRPRTRAFLALPLLVGYSFAWGFVNFGLGLAIQLLVLSRIIGRASGRPASARDDLITAVLAVLGAWTHLLASALGYMLHLVAIVVDVQTRRAALAARLGRAVRIGVPLLPAIGYCALVYVRQKQLAWQNFEYGKHEGNDAFALVKVKDFLDFTAGLRADQLDAKVVAIVLGLLLISALFRDLDDAPPPVLRWLFVASLVAYLVIPHVFWATNFVFERISFLVVLTAILWAPKMSAPREELAQIVALSLGLFTATAFVVWTGEVRAQTADLDAILDQMPKGRRVTGLVHQPKIPATQQWSLLHSPAFYVARNGGEVAFSFTRTMSLPVHYKRETLPPDPPANFEWNPGDYAPDLPFARYFDLLLVKTVRPGDPRGALFGARAEQVTVVAQRGAWWILDTKALAARPVLDDRGSDDHEGGP